MNEVWLVSVPLEKSLNETFNTLNDTTAVKMNLCNNYTFPIPELKVGTLDQLVGLSDDLSRLDIYAEQVARKVASYLNDVMQDQKDKVDESLKAGDKSLMAYLTKFHWDSAKYPTKHSLHTIADIISKQIGGVEFELKQKSTAYNNLKGNLQNLEKKQTGSLLSRNLADLVKKEHFVLNSEYMVTLLVVVPKHSFNEWYANYYKMTDMVVPESTTLIYQDNEHGLFNVTLFRKVVDEFKIRARERRFIVRDFVYNENDIENGRNEITKLITDKKRQFGPLVRWLKVNFSECFCAWVHVKALRVFIESVLRYGLPVNFVAALIVPGRKNVKRLRDVLQQLYGHLDGSGGGGGGKSALGSSSSSAAASNFDAVDIPGLSFGQAEYYPYVCYKISLEMVEQKL